MPPKTPPKQVKEDLQAGLQALTVVYTRVRMRPVIPDKTDDRYSTPDKSWGTGKKVRLPYQKVLDAVIDQVNIDRNAAGRDELGEGAVLNQVISKLAKMAGGRREDADAFAAVCAAVNATDPETHAWRELEEGRSHVERENAEPNAAAPRDAGGTPGGPQPRGLHTRSAATPTSAGLMPPPPARPPAAGTEDTPFALAQRPSSSREGMRSQSNVLELTAQICGLDARQLSAVGGALDARVTAALLEGACGGAFPAAALPPELSPGCKGALLRALLQDGDAVAALGSLQRDDSSPQDGDDAGDDAASAEAPLPPAPSPHLAPCRELVARLPEAELMYLLDAVVGPAMEVD